ncbi:hypothetical protein D9Q98_005329 [Chlorella vulgaris]|uniref:Polygalacturonase n=1 Tax=Chlorella vulgaris TaxID=3077 RepID=A0A9D4TLX8_CHLVU|nr:hypothetical protein D9Q98_005329 [Chlorella vulgaris]
MLHVLVLMVTMAAAASASTHLPPLHKLAAARPCLASHYGALPSSTRYSTAALQAAIDDCATRCGTVVVDSPGTYLTASLLLTGCVHLHLPSGVTLLAGTQRRDYPPTGQPDWYLLRFFDCSGCSLTGGGTVDGQARAWVLSDRQQAASPRQQQQQQLQARPAADSFTLGVERGGPDSTSRRLTSAQAHLQQQQQQRQASGSSRVLPPPPDIPRKAVRNWADPSCLKPEECRPRLVGLVDSRGMSISGVRLTDPVYWCLHVLRCEHVSISSVRILGDWAVPNNDGIDVDGSRHVSISHADVDTADDAICIKTTTEGHPVRNVTVSDCRLRSRSSAIKLGSESVADMQRISFTRLAIRDSNRGLAIQLRDGGSISSVRFKHIAITTRHYDASWWGAAEPIHVSAVPRRPGVQVGTVSDLHFSDINVAAAESGIFLAGGPMHCSASHSFGGNSCDCSGISCTGGSTRDSGGGIQSSSGSGLLGSSLPAGLHAAELPPLRPQPLQHTLSDILLQRVKFRLLSRSGFEGGCQDYRPSSNASSGLTLPGSDGGGVGCGSSSDGAACRCCWWPAGLDCSSGSTAALWVSGADDVRLTDVQIHYSCPRRPDWKQQLHIDPGSTSDVVLKRVKVTADSCSDESVM